MSNLSWFQSAQNLYHGVILGTETIIIVNWPNWEILLWRLPIPKFNQYYMYSTTACNCNFPSTKKETTQMLQITNISSYAWVILGVPSSHHWVHIAYPPFVPSLSFYSPSFLELSRNPFSSAREKAEECRADAAWPALWWGWRTGRYWKADIHPLSTEYGGK